MNNRQKALRIVAAISCLIGGVGVVQKLIGYELERIEEETHTREILILSMKGCGPCVTMGKQLPALRRLAGPLVTVEQVYPSTNVNAFVEEIYQKYGIRISGFPTIIVVVDGKVVQKFVGSKSAQELWNAIDKSKLYL